jgi:uncharacterized damage-inducible protein DinB
MTPAAVHALDRSALLRQLDAAFTGPAWHGPSLLGSVRGVAADEAEWRPAPDRHSIRDLVLHAAYAKHRVMLRLDPTAARRFPRRLGAAWWPVPAPDARWEDDRELLVECHRRLTEVVARVPASRLATSRRGKPYTLGEEVAGVALHDAYHAGQVRLLRRLHP